MRRLWLLLALFALGVTACGPGEKDQAPSDSTDSVTVELIGEDSVSVFDLLERNHAVDYHSTISGVFVTGIDSVENSQAGYWVYTVNDTSPQVAADRMLTRDGDTVVWHFRRTN